MSRQQPHRDVALLSFKSPDLSNRHVVRTIIRTRPRPREGRFTSGSKQNDGNSAPMSARVSRGADRSVTRCHRSVAAPLVKKSSRPCRDSDDCAYNMGDWRRSGDFEADKADIAVWLLTLTLTVVTDLTFAVEVGMVLRR